MSGQTVIFQTAVAVVCQAMGFEQVDLAPVRVRFRSPGRRRDRTLSARRAALRLRRKRQSEGLGISLLDAIDSDDPTALIGLPLIRTCRMLRAAGLVLP